MLQKEYLREQLNLAEEINSNVLQTIYNEKWLNTWVPKEYGGLGYTLEKGLKVLRQLAFIDGSLGWLVTLCSGANYFSRNLKPAIASNIFNNQNVCFGGSGILGGYAEKTGDNYIINGSWDYATGAPYLSHFTLNAQITKNGSPQVDNDGSPVFRSFVLDASQVELIPSWKSMGMTATVSHSFKVENQLVHQDFSFVYDTFYTSEILNNIPFEVFADLTLIVNYLGMAEHFFEASTLNSVSPLQKDLVDFIYQKDKEVYSYAVNVERQILQNGSLDREMITEIHEFCQNIVDKLISLIIKIYPNLGIKASRSNEEINQVFRDFFTATQHKNFRRV